MNRQAGLEDTAGAIPCAPITQSGPERCLPDDIESPLRLGVGKQLPRRGSQCRVVRLLQVVGHDRPVRDVGETGRALSVGALGSYREDLLIQHRRVLVVGHRLGRDLREGGRLAGGADQASCTAT